MPEAKPTFRRGLLAGDTPEPIEVVMPKDFPISRCYRFDYERKNELEVDEANAHLLAALGTFNEPFVPVSIAGGYDGYAWAKLPVITKVEVTAGKKLHESYLWSGKLVCVDSITTTAHTSDDKVWRSPVCMAVRPLPDDDKRRWFDHEVLVTPQAQERLSARDIWYHLGGWDEDGDLFDTQQMEFEEDLQRFWAMLVGPDENLRRKILAPVQGLQTDWETITILRTGVVTIRDARGELRILPPPAA